jgi:hypothetical protein
VAKGTCSVCGREDNHLRRGMCEAHYQRAKKRGGDPGPAEVRVRIHNSDNDGPCLAGCGEPAKVRGMCRRHYGRAHRNGGDPGPAGFRGDLSEAARFESRVDRSGGPDACHMFDGSPGAEGYCHFAAGGETRMAHAFAWELANGPLPEDPETGRRYDVDHLCHNEALKAGTCEPGNL